MIIIQDTREKMPWDFTFYGHEQVVATVKTGDYTVKGFENDIFIERKRNTGEIAINLGKKSETFHRELERAKPFKHKYIICEFDEEDLFSFPANSGIPDAVIPKIRINGIYLSSELNKIKHRYGITIIYAGSANRAEKIVLEILENVTEDNNPA